MLWCGIVTLFPEMIRAITDYGITRRAVEQKLLEVHCWNPRDFAENRHHTVDDRPYGGGPGMVMQVYPLRHAIQAARKAAMGPVKVVCLSPQGKKLDQAEISAAVKNERYIFIAGRYEGIDERLIDLEVDE
jgi:tRNA (guanine37-N1)-methyltransferase